MQTKEHDDNFSTDTPLRLPDDWISDYCDNCHKGGATQRCGNCRSHYYCSIGCQVAHWKSSHKKDCAHEAVRYATAEFCLSWELTKQRPTTVSAGVSKAIIEVRTLREFVAAGLLVQRLIRKDVVAANAEIAEFCKKHACTDVNGCPCFSSFFYDAMRKKIKERK